MVNNVKRPALGMKNNDSKAMGVKPTLKFVCILVAYATKYGAQLSRDRYSAGHRCRDGFLPSYLESKAIAETGCPAWAGK
jgi:hypothetical protein